MKVNQQQLRPRMHANEREYGLGLNGSSSCGWE